MAVTARLLFVCLVAYAVHVELAAGQNPGGQPVGPAGQNPAGTGGGAGGQPLGPVGQNPAGTGGSASGQPVGPAGQNPAWTGGGAGGQPVGPAGQNPGGTGGGAGGQPVGPVWQNSGGTGGDAGRQPVGPGGQNPGGTGGGEGGQAAGQNPGGTGGGEGGQAAGQSPGDADADAEEECSMLWCGTTVDAILLVAAIWVLVAGSLWQAIWKAAQDLHANYVKRESSDAKEKGATGAAGEDASSLVIVQAEQSRARTDSDEQSKLLDEKDKGKKPARVRLEGLGAARLLASLHVASKHLTDKDDRIAHLAWDETPAAAVLSDMGPLERLVGWGFTWVPWFFMVSGFVLTYSKLTAAGPHRPEEPLPYVNKRLATIFPVYALGIVASALGAVVLNTEVRLSKAGGEYTSVLLDAGDTGMLLISLLMQAWVPDMTEYCLQAHTWFLSCLVVYWVAFCWLYDWMREMSIAAIGAAAAACASVPWLYFALVAIAGEDQGWYTAHDWMGRGSEVDFWSTVLKFSPPAYLHVFAFGMLLAHLLHHSRDDTNQPHPLITLLRPLLRYGATLGYVGLLGVMMGTSSWDYAWSHMVARLGAFMPLQGLVVLGLASKHDPLTTLFSAAPQWLAESSYALYVFQFVWLQLWPDHPVTFNSTDYFLGLLGVSVLLTIWVHKPAAKLWLDYPKYTPAAPVALFVTLEVLLHCDLVFNDRNA